MLLESFNNSQVFGSVCCFNKIEFHTLVARIFEFVLFIAFSAESDLWNWIKIVSTFHTYSHSHSHICMYFFELKHIIDPYRSHFWIEFSRIPCVFTFYQYSIYSLEMILLSDVTHSQRCLQLKHLCTMYVTSFRLITTSTNWHRFFNAHWLHINFEWCDDRIPGLS